MAVLPSPEDVGPIPDSPGRRTGIAGWNPRVISEAGHEAGAGFERLGADIGQVGIEDQQRQDALQMAQARGDAAAAVTNTLATLPSVTDSSKLPAMQESVAGAVGAAGARLNPYQRNLFDAEHEGILAQANAHINARGREIDNQNAVSNLDTTSTDTIGKAASLDTDAAGVAALDPINKQIGDLVTAGALTPEQGVAYKRRAVEQFVGARSKYLYANAIKTQSQADWQKYNDFLALPPDMAGAAPGQPPGSPTIQPGPVGPQPGMVAPGNIDLAHRPVAHNDDGTISTVRSISIGVDGKEVVIPTVIDGKVVSDEEAKAHYRKTGENLGTFDTVANAEAFATRLHDAQAAFYGPNGPGQPPAPSTGAYPPSVPSPSGAAPAAFIMHHTAGGGTPADVVNFWKQQGRGYGAQYIMDRQGVIHDTQKEFGYSGTNEILNDPAHGLSNGNVVGMEIIAKDDSDVTPQQAKSAAAFIRARYPNTPVFGHGQVNPGHKEATEGLTATQAVENDRKNYPASAPASGFMDSVAQIESGNRNIPSGTDKDYPGHPGSRSQGFWQIDVPTWGQFAPRAGVDVAKYPTPMNAPREVQQQVAEAIPLSRFGPETQRKLREQYGDLNGQSTLGELARGRGGISTGGPGNYRPFGATAPVSVSGAGAAPIILSAPSTDVQPASYGSAPMSGLPMVGGGIPLAPPPQTEWPDGAQSVVQNGDGSMSYRMRDGSFVPIPESATPFGGGAPLGPIPKNSPLSLLPPDKAAEMRLQGVRENLMMQRQRAMMMRRDIRGDLASIDTMVGAMTKGTIPDPDAIARSDAVFSGPGVDPRVQYEWAQAKQIADNLRPLQGQPPAQVSATASAWRAQVEALRQKDPFNPALPGLDAVAKAGESYAQVYEQGLKKNPYAVAARDGVISYTPLDPGNAQTIAKRVEDRDAVAQHYGLPSVPLLTADDRTTLRNISRQGGKPFVDAAKNIVAGAGAQAGEVFQEIGGTSPEFITIGQLALDQNVDHSDTIDRLAQRIADSNDKSKSKDLIYLTKSAINKAGLVDPTGTALSGMGAAFQATSLHAGRELAGDELTERNLDPAADPTTFHDHGQDLLNRNYNLAVGGHYDNGVQFGGFQHMSAHSWFLGRPGPPQAYDVLVPSDMAAAKFGDVISRLTDSDIAKAPSAPYSIGRNEPINANTIKNGQFVAVPNKRTGTFDGMYKVLLPDPKTNDMVPVVDKQGNPWILDLSGLAKDPGFRGRIPGAFTPSLGAPISPRYRSTPGLIEPPAPVTVEPGSA